MSKRALRIEGFAGRARFTTVVMDCQVCHRSGAYSLPNDLDAICRSGDIQFIHIQHLERRGKADALQCQPSLREPLLAKHRNPLLSSRTPTW